MDDLLQTQLAAIIKYCTAKNTPCFFGDFDDQKLTLVNWASSNNDWENFLSGVRIVPGNEVLIISTKVYEESAFLYPEFFNQPTGDPLLEDMLLHAAALKPFEGHIYFLKLAVLRGNVCYQYTAIADWITQVLSLTQLLEEYDSQEETENGEDELSDEEIEGHIRLLLNSERYYKTAQQYQRRQVAGKILDDLTYEGVEIVFAAAEIELNDFLQAKVQDLKSQGKTRAEIKSILQMSDDRLKRFYAA